MKKYFLTTERIGFSHWEKDDIVLAVFLWGDKEVTKYLTANEVFSEAEIIDRLTVEIKNQEQFGVQYWPIFDRLTNEFMGCCGLRPRDIAQNIYEIGFHLKSKYWGKALAPEAAKAVMQYAFKTLHVTELFAGHHPNNTGSKKVLEGLGFCYSNDVYYSPTGLYHPVYRYNICQK